MNGARARDRKPLLAPRSLVIVGASTTNPYATRLLANLDGGGFGGRLYPVNPRQTEVAGRPCDPSIGAAADVIARLGRLALDLADRIAEIDINPSRVRGEGAGAVAGDALVMLSPPTEHEPVTESHDRAAPRISRACARIWGGLGGPSTPPMT